MMAPTYGLVNRKQTILFGKFCDHSVDDPPQVKAVIPSSTIPSEVLEDDRKTSFHSTSSPFFVMLPLEIRRLIYKNVFTGSVILVESRGRSVRCSNCDTAVLCSSIASHGRTGCIFRGKPLISTGPAQYRVLQTCAAFYKEARCILASELRLYIAVSLCGTFQFQMMSSTGHPSFLKFALPDIRYLYTGSAAADDDFLLPSYLPKLHTFELGMVWFISSAICPLLYVCRQQLEKKSNEAQLVDSLQKLVRHEDVNISRLVRLKGRSFNIIVIVDLDLGGRNGCVSVLVSLEQMQGIDCET
jgi:hypothetical protein